MKWWWRRERSSARDQALPTDEVSAPRSPPREIGDVVPANLAFAIEGSGAFLQCRAWVAEGGIVIWSGNVQQFLALVRKAASNFRGLDCTSSPDSAAPMDQKEG